MGAEEKTQPHASGIPLAGVIGWPIAHSRSPRLHGHWLRRYRLPGFYVPLAVREGDLAQVLATLPLAGFVGANVTLPHKEEALRLSTEASGRAQRIGAANTLTFRPDGSLFADNTDGIGFLANLRQGAAHWQPERAPAALVGAGGAARALVVALLDAKVPELRIANRTRDRAERLRAEFGPRLRVFDWAERAAMLDGAGTVVNATSAGMVGKPPLDLDLGRLAPGCVVTDLVYEPLETEFLRRARARRAVVVDGLGMLLHQAVPGFEAWFGRRPEVDDDLRRAVLA